ncbi:hypothetical protein [Ramlibacter pallidus]|uniref:hypothetical protein n=1 Tax=Ramlibacter pallidus TaxID=2780087 RepID=UPI001D0D1378|nr:hypothetical protein [Ramlibacter pallidus]
MSTDTSIGPDAGRGSNDNPGNADGCGNKTLGTQATQQPPTGAGVVDEAGAQVPAGVPGARPRSGVTQGPASYPDGPNVESSPWELDAARGKLPKDKDR